jgi:hypothetical protein
LFQLGNLEHQRQLILSIAKPLHHQIRLAFGELPPRRRLDHLQTRLCLRQVVGCLLPQLLEPIMILGQFLL